MWDYERLIRKLVRRDDESATVVVFESPSVRVSFHEASGVADADGLPVHPEGPRRPSRPELPPTGHTAFFEGSGLAWIVEAAQVVASSPHLPRPEFPRFVSNLSRSTRSEGSWRVPRENCAMAASRSISRPRAPSPQGRWPGGVPGELLRSRREPPEPFQGVVEERATLGQPSPDGDDLDEDERSEDDRHDSRP